MNSKYKGYISILVILIVYLSIMIILPVEKNNSYWASILFTIVAILVQGAIFHIKITKNRDYKNKFLGLPILIIGYYYLIIQFIWGIAALVIPMISFRTNIAISILFLGVFLFLLIGIEETIDEIKRVDQKVKNDSDFITSSVLSIDRMICEIEKVDLNNRLIELRDDFRYSDPISNEATKEEEEKIKDYFEELLKLDRSETNKLIAIVERIRERLRFRNKLVKEFKDK